MACQKLGSAFAVVRVARAAIRRRLHPPQVDQSVLLVIPDRAVVLTHVGPDRCTLAFNSGGNTTAASLELQAAGYRVDLADDGLVVWYDRKGGVL